MLVRPASRARHRSARAPRRPSPARSVSRSGRRPRAPAALAHQPQHGLHEFCRGRVDPGCAHTTAALRQRVDSTAARPPACCAVHAERIGRALGSRTASRLAVENEVGGHVDQSRADAGGGSRQSCGTARVHARAPAPARSRPVDRGVGSRVDDHVRPRSRTRSRPARASAMSSCCVPGAMISTSGGRAARERRPSWPRGAGQQDSHAKALRRGERPARRILRRQHRRDAAASGQSMPSCGSFQRMHRSCVGRVVVGALVEEFGRRAEHEEAVREARRHPQHALVLGGQLGADPLAERRRAATQVDRDVEHRAAASRAPACPADAAAGSAGRAA